MESIEQATKIGYKYIDCTCKGYKRVKVGKSYRYKNLRGAYITNERTLKRINALVIPPAWKRVWICPDPKGHIQCFGYDLRDRKQYIYHKEWTQEQNDSKFQKVLALGPYLPTLQRRINKDLKLPEWTKDKVSALALALIKRTLMRVGNARYTKANKSYGLTTLKKSHVTLSKEEITISYVGKKGVSQLHVVKDKKLYNFLSSLAEIPGKNLFQYRDSGASKGVKKLRGRDVNAYLKGQNTEHKLSVKSFRIWGATILAVKLMAAIQSEYDLKNSQKLLNAIIDEIAKELGNTRAVAKKYYVHPLIQELFLEGTFYRKAKLKLGARRLTIPQAEAICQRLLR
ncbi:MULTISPECIES: DNA topoisomerase IB [Sphingobacterium]|uniref:DNA topoisomerase n=1 Tax=Sphingobacterium populi TaxID=1812824 RepID=A0ABW5UEW2_9SPHI|nr:DNA topoisomerase IB [Sphingobacterium sp. CFCC 11742]